ncbi:hypothetical protein CFIMG_007107RA [Ceratocystis fimbriata CBS 114723]|uniref:Uncharacterized protein n=1 Tax=Ceratocystis fimbriata CBS 114723 TaxID=1035309 RepID=A0A2C5WPZ0_9PEZI|nr:hypothetical protein CFIMG_007107RA [Ceratocystis fimbriata CBS 114723]
MPAVAPISHQGAQNGSDRNVIHVMSVIFTTANSDEKCPHDWNEADYGLTEISPAVDVKDMELASQP